MERKKSIVGVLVIIGLFLPFLFGLLFGHLFSLSAVVSDSMEPNIQAGDMVIMSDTSGPLYSGSDDINTVVGSNEKVLGRSGSVVSFRSSQLPEVTIHRAVYQVKPNENWVKTLSSAGYNISSPCRDISSCPAPYAGYITKGDGNPFIDQVVGLSIIKSSQIQSVGIVSIPYLGVPSKVLYDNGIRGDSLPFRNPRGDHIEVFK